MLEDRLRAVPFFRTLPGDSVRALAASLRSEEHTTGDVIFCEGDPAEALYLVDVGVVEVRRGGEALAVLGPGSFVGELGLLLGEPRSADLVAVADVRLSTLTRSALDALLEQHPALGLELSRELGRRLIATNQRLSGPVPPRVVAFWGDRADVDAFVDELRGLAGGGVEPVVLAPDEPVPPAATAADDLFLAVLPPVRTRASRATLRAAEFVVCAQAPPAWVVRRHEDSRVLRCDQRVPLARAARWVAGRAAGLALSSGGSKTVAHLGVTTALEGAGVTFDAIAGSSGGAVVAAALAVGFGAERRQRHLQEVIELLGVRRWDFNVPPRTGVMKGRRLRDALDRMFDGRTFDDTLLPLSLVATDLATGGEVVLDSGSLADAVRASIGIPGAFDPWPLDGRLLVDGAIVNPVPASVLRNRGVPVVVASMVAGKPERGDAPLTVPPPIMQTLLRMVNLMERELISTQLPLIDVLIRPDVSAGYSFDFSHAEQHLAEGERAAKAALPALRAALAGGREGRSPAPG